MGRFSAIVLVLAAACGDNLSPEDNGPGQKDQIDPNGNATAVPRYVPSVCGVQTWSPNTVGDPSLNVSVAARPDGAVVLAAPRAGGTLTGFVLDTRMNMMTTNKIPIDGAFTSVSASYLMGRVAASAVLNDAVHMYLLEDDLTSPQYVAKLPGRFMAEPAFYKVQADRVMPTVSEGGLWMHRIDDSFEPLESKLVVATDPSIPVLSMAAAQMGVATFVSWSDAKQCHMMLTSTFSKGIYTNIDATCVDQRIAVNPSTGAGVMVFESEEGVRMMHINGTQFGGDARVLRDSTSAPRTLFDGTNLWISYLDTRGDIIVGFLDANRNMVSMSLAGPKPDTYAYEFAMVDNNPWVFALGDDGYTAHRMCIDTHW